MICMARAIDKETLKKEPSIMTVINTNSPLKVDQPMLDWLMLLAEFGQPSIVTSFTLLLLRPSTGHADSRFF